MQQQTNSSWIYVAGAMPSAVQNFLQSKHIIRQKFLSNSSKQLACSNWDFYVLNRNGDRFQTPDTLNYAKLINNYMCHLL